MFGVLEGFLLISQLAQPERLSFLSKSQMFFSLYKEI